MIEIIVCPYPDHFWVHIPKQISAKIPTPPRFFTDVNGEKVLRPVNITRIVGFPAYLWYNKKWVLVYTDKKHSSKFSSNVGFIDISWKKKLTAYFSAKPAGEYI